MQWWLLGIISLFFLGASPAEVAATDTRDFIQYYCAARILIDGENPYDGATQLRYQQAYSPKLLTQPVSLWNPPWSLSFYLPWGMIGKIQTALLSWRIMQLFFVWVSVFFLGRQQQLPLIYCVLLPCLFSPVFWMYHFGQNTGMLLLGLAGTLYFQKKAQWCCAGWALALTALKPHLLLLYALALALHGREKIVFRSISVGVLVLSAASCLAWSMQPHIFQQFWHAFGETESAVPVKNWQVPLVSYHVRMLIQPEQFLWQFLPILLGALLLLALRLQGVMLLRYPAEILYYSLILTPYGGWIFDQVLLIVPIIFTLKEVQSLKLSRRIIIVLAMIAVSLAALQIRGLEESVWFSPAYALIHIVIKIFRYKPNPSPNGGPE